MQRSLLAGIQTSWLTFFSKLVQNTVFSRWRLQCAERKFVRQHTVADIHCLDVPRRAPMPHAAFMTNLKSDSWKTGIAFTWHKNTKHWALTSTLEDNITQQHAWNWNRLTPCFPLVFQGIPRAKPGRFGLQSEIQTHEPSAIRRPYCVMWRGNLWCREAVSRQRPLTRGSPKLFTTKSSSERFRPESEPHRSHRAHRSHRSRAGRW